MSKKFFKCRKRLGDVLLHPLLGWALLMLSFIFMSSIDLIQLPASDGRVYEDSPVVFAGNSAKRFFAALLLYAAAVAHAFKLSQSLKAFLRGAVMLIFGAAFLLLAFIVRAWPQ